MSQTQTEGRNAELIERYYRAIDDGEFDAAAGLFAPEYHTNFLSPGVEGAGGGVDRLRARWERNVEAFPDLSVSLREVVADDEWVLCRAVYTGTHDGEFVGIEPTGERVKFQTHASFRIEDGAIAETYSSGGYATVLSAIGVDLPGVESGTTGETAATRAGAPGQD
jgi:predicted ester cyclase